MKPLDEWIKKNAQDLSDDIKVHLSEVVCLKSMPIGLSLEEKEALHRLIMTSVREWAWKLK